MTIGDRIKSARKKAGITQAELAKRLGISYVGVSQWENNLRNPKIETVQRIASALNVSIVDLVGTADELNGQIVQHLQEARKSLEEQKEASSDYEKQTKFGQAVLSLDSAAYKASYQDAAEAEERAKEIFSALRVLNSTGRQEAVKRVQELSYVPDYQKDKTPLEAKEKAPEGE